MRVERFAPSPTGPLHLGHAFSALTAFRHAKGGRFLLRIEDIDQSRCRPEWEAQIYDDLTWLGVTWETPVLRQSSRLPAYHDALMRLWDVGLLFACNCRRADIAAALGAPQEGVPQSGPDGPIYPGTCRHRRKTADMITPPAGMALRLDMARAVERVAGPLSFTEAGSATQGQTGEITISPDHLVTLVGDVALARVAMGTSYHLSVVLDDAAQGVTHITRGQDLFEATAIHIVLQRLLGLQTPGYHHHRLIRDETGKRLAKRDDARAIARYRADGLSRADVLTLAGL